MKQQVKINTVKSNPNNPRIIKDAKFQKLVQSLKDFPEMLEKRPIVVDENMVVLGGNMRLKASVEAGLKQVWIDVAEGWTDAQKKEFVIKDNASFGDWDWDILANEYDPADLSNWGLDVWQPEEEVDYSILDDEDLSKELDDMLSGVKKAIQIEFLQEHYEEAQELVKFWRQQEAYIGAMLIEHLKAEKEKL
jgi:ParB-like chromosome segregation protein Spo0J